MILAVALSAILGHAVPEWPQKPAERWVQGGPLTLAGLRGKVVLVRFFTDTSCPYCSATAPALNGLDEEFRDQGLVVVGMYTPKPDPRPVGSDEARRAVAAYGFNFPVAIDDDWAVLETEWLHRVKHARFTSASLLIDRRGILRHVQEGGAYAKDAADPKARQDYDAMRRAIVACLAETP